MKREQGRGKRVEWDLKRILEWDTPERVDEAELIDDESQPFDDLRFSMRDVQRANRFLGGTTIVARQTKAWLRYGEVWKPGGRETTFLDIATGTGDLPRVILKVALDRWFRVRVIGLDYSDRILQIAREEIGNEPEVRLMRGTAFRLPFADQSVDYAICSLAFHHFGFEGSVTALREMERVTRHGWLVNDLRRSRIAWHLFRAVSWITRMNLLTQHDGPASILRAYSIPEYRNMGLALGLEEGREFRIRRHPFFRVAMVRDKSWPKLP